MMEMTKSGLTTYDGYLFMPDKALLDWPEMYQWMFTVGNNYWHRNDYICGFIGPKMEDA